MTIGHNTLALQKMLINTNRVEKQVKRKSKEQNQFKPEHNQLNIKSVITPRPQRQCNQPSVQKVGDKIDQSVPNTKQTGKKCDMSSPPEQLNPKQANMNNEAAEKPMDKDENTIELSKEVSVKSQHDVLKSVISSNNNNPVTTNDTGNNSDSAEVLNVNQRKITLSLELQYLRELLKEDMEKMLIKPLQDRMAVIEKLHEVLESKGVLIDTIKAENKQLKHDCNLIRLENEKLKQKIDNIETKLISSNVVLYGIEDQAWELSDVTREKALTAISSIANGNTVKEKLDVVRKIGIRDIRCVGTYNSHRPRVITVEFE